MGRFLLACLVVAALARPLGAAEAWTYGSSPHFEVYTTGGEKRARERR